jgi:hypothetical protein
MKTGGALAITPGRQVARSGGRRFSEQSSAHRNLRPSHFSGIVLGRLGTSDLAGCAKRGAGTLDPALATRLESGARRIAGVMSGRLPAIYSIPCSTITLDRDGANDACPHVPPIVHVKATGRGPKDRAKRRTNPTRPADDNSDHARNPAQPAPCESQVATQIEAERPGRMLLRVKGDYRLGDHAGRRAATV